MAHQRSPPQACPKLIAQDEIVPLARGNIDKLREVREKVVRNVSLQAVTYESVVTPLADAQHAIEDSYGVIGMLKYAAPDDRTRQASKEANHLWDQAWSEFNNDYDVYLLLQAVKDRNKDLEAEHAKYLDELLADLGVGADLFGEFVDDPRRKETWERFRSTILVRGASRDEMSNLQEFLGRMPGTEAMIFSCAL